MKQPKYFINTNKTKKKEHSENYYALQSKANTMWKDFAKKNELKGMTCSYCHKRIAIAHHPDYSKPFSVVWLCKQCHAKAHMGLINPKRAINYKRGVSISGSPANCRIWKIFSLGEAGN